jgi:thymidylate synthase
LAHSAPHIAFYNSEEELGDSNLVMEIGYLNLVKDIIDHGDYRSDRTGIGTTSLFGQKLTFSLRDGQIPVFTTKKIYWRGVVEELLWMLRGDTNANHLSERGVKIWDANASRAFLDSRGLYDLKEGDIGAGYGFQWRHYGVKYLGMDADYRGQGVDQLAQVVDTLKRDPFSRRIVMSAWNPSDLNMMALPPCHMFCQFYVNSKRELSCCMYQRSADMGLGVPFNVASYSLLTHLIARVCDLEPCEFVHMIGDAHVYKNHVEPLSEQVKRTPYAPPTLEIKKQQQLKSIEDIEQLTSDDIKLSNYQHYPTIQMEMAV